MGISSTAKLLSLLLFATLASGCGTQAAPSVGWLNAAGTHRASSHAAKVGSLRLILEARGGYHTLATPMTAATLRVRLTAPGLDAAMTRTVSATELASGHVALSFNGLPLGPVTVTIDALDATGQVITTQSSVVTVGAAQTAAVTMQVAPAGAVAAAQASATGDVAVSLAILDGEEPEPQVAVTTPTTSGSSDTDDAQVGGEDPDTAR